MSKIKAWAKALAEDICQPDADEDKTLVATCPGSHANVTPSRDQGEMACSDCGRPTSVVRYHHPLFGESYMLAPHNERP